MISVAGINKSFAGGRGGKSVLAVDDLSFTVDSKPLS